MSIAQAQKTERPAGTGRTAGQKTTGTSEAYRADGSTATEPPASKWFANRKRKVIDAVGACPIEWPADPAARHQVLRDWNAIAMRRIRPHKAGDETIGQFWRFINLRDEPGSMWPSDDMLADCAQVSTKTIGRHIKNYVALGIVKTRRQWRKAPGGAKHLVRVIELTFPTDLSRGDFTGRAFGKDAWRRYLKDEYSDPHGPNTQQDDDAIYSDTHGPNRNECPAGPDDEYSDHACPAYSDPHGPDNDEGIDEGGDLQSPPININDTFEVDQSVDYGAREGAPSSQPISSYRLKQPVDLGHLGTGRVIAIGRWYQALAILVDCGGDDTLVVKLRADRSLLLTDIREQGDLTHEEFAALDWDEEL